MVSEGRQSRRHLDLHVHIEHFDALKGDGRYPSHHALPPLRHANRGGA